jgi:DNA polymerase-3 subunit beta
MRIITTVSDIAEYLPGLLSVVPKRPTHPVLANIYLETVKEEHKEGIILRATDLSGFLEVFIPCDVRESGSVCIPAKMFSDILTVQTKSKKKVSGTLELSSDGDNLISIKTSSASQKLQGMSGDEFIEMPKQDNAKIVKLNGVQFVNKCDLLSKYVSTDCTKQVLQHIQLANKKLIATDGHKIAFAAIQTNEGVTDFCINPAMVSTLKRLNLVKKLADLECEDIELLVEDIYQYGSIFVEFGNWRLNWRTVEFKDITKHIPILANVIAFEVDRADLISKLKAAIACSDITKATKLWLHSQAGRLYLIANNSKDSLETNITEPVSFIINAENLLIVIETLKVKVVKLILPQSEADGLMGIDIDGVNVCLARRKRDNGDTDILNKFIENTNFIGTRDIINKIYQEEVMASLEPLVKKRQAVDIVETLPEPKQITVAVLEPVISEPTVDDKVREAIAHLQSLLATVPDVQMREAIVKEVMAVV